MEITIYTMENCPYCVKAKDFFRQRGVFYREIKVDENDDCVRSELEEKTGLKTLPQIFLGNKSVGGYSDLVELDKSGELNKFLNKENFK